MMTRPLLYTAELDLAEPDIEPFNRWYASRHAPDVYQCGFLTCTCYRAEVGDMNLFDIYEIPGHEVFANPRYLGMQPRDPYMASLMAKRRNKAHTIYEQLLIAPDDPAAWLNADWLQVFRFAAPAALDEDIAAFLKAEAARLGASRLRYAVRTQDHPRNPTHRPRCMVVVEWPHRPPMEADVGVLLEAAFPGALTDGITLIGSRIYPLPDDPAH